MYLNPQLFSVVQHQVSFVADGPTQACSSARLRCLCSAPRLLQCSCCAARIRMGVPVNSSALVCGSLSSTASLRAQNKQSGHFRKYLLLLPRPSGSTLVHHPSDAALDFRVINMPRSSTPLALPGSTKPTSLPSAPGLQRFPGSTPPLLCLGLISASLAPAPDSSLHQFHRGPSSHLGSGSFSCINVVLGV